MKSRTHLFLFQSVFQSWCFICYPGGGVCYDGARGMDWFIGEERKFLGRHHHHQHRHHPHHNRRLCLVVQHCDQDSDHFWSSGCSSSGEKIGLSARRSFLGRNHVPPWWCWRRQYSPALKVKYCHGHYHDLDHWSWSLSVSWSWQWPFPLHGPDTDNVTHPYIGITL